MKSIRVMMLAGLLTLSAASCQSPSPAPDAYMWYPGQLASYLQAQQQKKSVERCVNVGYPGKFFAPVDEVTFRAKASDAKNLDWSATGESSVRQEGGYTLLTVRTDGTRLPAAMLKGQDISKWEATIDGGETWVPVESDVRFSIEGRYPDAEQEHIITLQPQSIETLENGDILVDFHEIEVGYVWFQAEGNGTVQCYVGETAVEALADNNARLEQYPLPEYQVSRRRTIQLPERAVRFLRIECTGDLTVSDIRFEAKMWPVERQMSFECSDPAVNELFEAGVKTLHTSMHNFYLDGVKRDYLPWAMDAVVSALSGDYVFGDRQIARNGISVALMPPHPQTSDWGIPDYPLHALIGLEQDYLRYGDMSTADMFRDRILAQAALYESALNEQGFLSAGQQRGMGFTPGWARKNGPDGSGTPAYAQMMLLESFRITAFFCTKWGEKELAAHYEGICDKLRSSITECFWDEGQLAFMNGFLRDGSLDTRISPHAQYWSVIAGLYPEEHYSDLFTKVLPEIPYYYEDISYDKGYEVLAYTKAGYVRECFDFLDRVFGDWLRQGHTRFPENFTPNGTTEEQLVFYRRPYGLSLCHGANGTPPVLAVLKGIFGFSQNPDRPSEYTIAPDLMDLEWARVSFPVAEGLITVEARKGGDVKVDAPAGAKVNVIKNK